jgi:hypothetical protein
MRCGCDADKQVSSSSHRRRYCELAKLLWSK